MKVAELFSRWRHTKGYGVHSPLAFRLLKHVVRPHRDVAYYGEEKLDSMAYGMAKSGRGRKEGISYRLLRRACILLRFVAEQQPSYVWVSPGLPELYSEAIRLAGCVVRIYDGEVFPDEISKADMLVLDNFKLKKGELKKVLLPGKALIAFESSQKFKDTAQSVMTGGVFLDAASTFLAVCTADPTVHSYKISSI